MSQRNDLDFFSINSDSVEIFKARKGKKISESFFSKRKEKICVVIFILTIVLMILYLLKHSHPSQIQKTKKIKRYVNANEFRDDQYIIYKDTEIVPESRRIYRHPNHKYMEKDLQYGGNMKQKLNVKKGALSLKSKTSTETQDAESKSKLKGQKAKGHKLQSESLKDITSAMRLKGVYLEIQNKETALKNQLNQKYYYSKEINNLIQNNSDDKGEGQKRFPKKIFKSQGVPFQLPTKRRKSYQQQKGSQNNVWLNQISMKHPITIYLDFYPVENFKKKPESNSPTRNEFHNSKPSQSVSDAKFLLPKDGRNRMIMKLHLYPKESLPSERNFIRHGERLQSKYNKKAQKRFFRWFFKPKTKKFEWKKCSIVGFHPHGKRIKAKWKNEDGEWIHAKHVTVKYLKEEKD